MRNIFKIYLRKYCSENKTKTKKIFQWKNINVNISSLHLNAMIDIQILYKPLCHSIPHLYWQNPLIIKFKNYSIRLEDWCIKIPQNCVGGFLNCLSNECFEQTVQVHVIEVLTQTFPVQKNPLMPSDMNRTMPDIKSIHNLHQ